VAIAAATFFLTVCSFRIPAMSCLQWAHKQPLCQKTKINDYQLIRKKAMPNGRISFFDFEEELTRFP
jgi:hypothetical protein